MKYVANVAAVLQRGIHLQGLPGDPQNEMPPAARIEIELDGAEAGPCMMYRYASDEAFAGDTWHQSLEEAFHQAEFEYGLQPSDFMAINGGE